MLKELNVDKNIVVEDDENLAKQQEEWWITRVYSMLIA